VIIRERTTAVKGAGAARSGLSERAAHVIGGAEKRAALKSAGYCAGTGTHGSGQLDTFG